LPAAGRLTSVGLLIQINDGATSACALGGINKGTRQRIRGHAGRLAVIDLLRLDRPFDEVFLQ